MNRLKRLFVVLAYCDSDLKKKLLKNNVSKLKSEHPNDLVAVISHYPVETGVQDIADYVVYDKSNPKVDYYLINWHIAKSGHKVINKEQDHGYAVFNLIKNGLLLSKNLECTETIFINYDVEYDTESLFKFMTPDISTVFPFVPDHIEPKQEDPFNLIIFKIISSDYKILIENINTDLYLSYLNEHSGNIPENYFRFLIEKILSFTILNKNDLNIREVISITDTGTVEGINIIKKSQVLLNRERTHLYVYIVLLRHCNITISINGILHEYENTDVICTSVGLNFSEVRLIKINEDIYDITLLTKNDIDLTVERRYIELT